MKGGARGRAAALPALAELFRERGFDGASLSDIGERTGLGKGSLYHFFPGGKEEMATSVLDEIAGWFEEAVYRPLRGSEDPRDLLLSSGRARKFGERRDQLHRCGR